jgi:hypothetical protein
MSWTDELKFWPTTDPRRVQDALSPTWNRVSYENLYGERATMAVDACRSAARFGDMRALVEAARRLDNALRKDRPGIFKF